MPRIVLKDTESEKTYMVADVEATVGRDPAASIVIDGPKSKVVSGRHTRIFFQDNTWWISDTSRNGTVLDSERLQPGQRHAIRVGQVVGLGDSGPRLKVAVLEARAVVETVMELPDLDAPNPPPQAAPASTAPRQSAPSSPAPRPTSPDGGQARTMAMRHSEAVRAGLNMEEATEPMGPSPDWVVHVVLRHTHSNQTFDIRGDVVRLGRSPACQIQISPEQGASVSRVHAEIAIQEGGVMVRDAGSRNGTFLNGKRVEEPHQCLKGDLVMLGAGGPTFVVEDLHIVKGEPAVQPETPREEGEEDAKPTPAPFARVSVPNEDARKGKKVLKPMGPATSLARRSFAGAGRTAFFRDVLEDMSQKSARRVRIIVWTSVIATVWIAGILLWVTNRRVQESERRIAQERAAFEARSDSIRRAASAEADQLRAAFDSARSSSAPRAVLDSLRSALADAMRRTGALEVALVRARQSLDQQLAAGDSARRNAEEEMNRLRLEVGRAQAGGAGSREALDSLRRALRSAEDRTADITNQLRTVRNSNADLEQVAAKNGNAVGLLTVYSKSGVFNGTGFVISPSGFLVTNRHNVLDSTGAADSIFVTMAGRRYTDWSRARVVAVGDDDLDVAILQLQGYRGLHVEKVDWTGTGARAGLPGALIGFPSGAKLALREGDTVAYLISPGAIARVTRPEIHFSGFTRQGSSGSPLFNASGEVVAIHYMGFRDTPGLSMAIPTPRILPLLPVQVRSELGIR